MMNRHLIILSLAALPLLAACQKQAAQAPEPPRPVKLVAVKEPASTRPIVLSGAITSRVESALGFRVPGKIIERKVDIGQRVQPGDVLARIDASDLILGLKTAEASVTSAKARLDVVNDELSRYQTLFSKGHVAQAALDRATLDVEQAQAALDQAKASRDQAANQAAYSDLIADQNGIVTVIHADRGQVVSAGTPVISVSRDEDKEAALAIAEQDIRYFHSAMPVDVSFWAEPGVTIQGRVREIAGAADPVSRTFAVRVSLPADPRIRLGQTATVTASVSVESPRPTVPLTALSLKDGQPVVWIADQTTSTVASRKVETGTATGESVQIVKGVAPGDYVVTAGTQFLTEGLKVKWPAAQLAEATSH